MTTEPYSLEWVEDSSILYFSVEDHYSVMQDHKNAAADVIKLLDKLSKPVFMIFDLAKLHLTLPDILHGSNEATRGTQAFLRHPMMRECLIISPNSIMQAVAKGMSSDAFGKAPVKAFATLEEAHAYIRSLTSG